MNQLQDRVAIVTGAGSGIGRAIALRFAEAGAHVACADINLVTSEETAKLVYEKGRRALALQVDVRHRKRLEEVVGLTVAELGELWACVANAGINRAGTLLTLQEEDWQQVIDVNLTGVFLTCQAAAREMVRANRGGRLICISSVAAERAFAGLIPYGASKAGVRHMTRSMAQELAPHAITANSIGPGHIATGFGGPETPENRKRISQMIPLGRVGEGEDVAGLATFLASDDAAYVTGSHYLIDGGLSDAMPSLGRSDRSKSSSAGFLV